MPWKDYIPITKVFGLFLAIIFYIVSLANRGWVLTPDTQWGLWSWCFTNFSDADIPEDHVNATHKCQDIKPGESPGYYEAVRTMACFTLVAVLLLTCTCNAKEGLGAGYKPSILACVACLGTVIVLSVLGGHFKDDRRWRSQDPSLGWCFWLTTASCSISFLLIFLLYISNKLQEDSNNSISQDPNANRLQRRNSNASTFSLHGNQKITVFRMPPDEGAGSGRHPQRPPGDAASAASLSTRSCRRGDGGDGGQFPMLNLPRYDLPSEPGRGAQTVPPPSYEDVVGGGTLSPPPPYVVAEFSEQKSG